MEDKLKNLRSKMDRTVLKKGELSEREKDQIYNHVMNSSKDRKKTRRFVPVFSLASCLVVLIILGSYFYSNYIGMNVAEIEEPQESKNFAEHNSREKEVIDPYSETDQDVFENEDYQKIYDYLKVWELPEKNQLSVDEIRASTSVTYRNGYSFSKETGYITSIDWGDRDLATDDRPLPTEGQYMGVVMGYINEKAADLEVELFPPLFTQVYDKSDKIVTYVNSDGIKAIHDRSNALIKRLDLAMRYAGELPELKSEMEEIQVEADSLANVATNEDDNRMERAKELNQQYEELVNHVAELSEVIDKARADKVK